MDRSEDLTKFSWTRVFAAVEERLRQLRVDGLVDSEEPPPTREIGFYQTILAKRETLHTDASIFTKIGSLAKFRAILRQCGLDVLQLNEVRKNGFTPTELTVFRTLSKVLEGER